MKQNHHINEKLGNRLKLYSEIRKALAVFKGIDYSIITGGYVQNERKLNDVDIITVTPYISSELREDLVSFAKKHINAQTKNGFVPDCQFPTDVITRQQIRDAVSGRALEVVNGELKLKKYSNEEISTKLEADYRVWLFEMITHDFDLIGGSFERLVCDTLQAHKTIFLLLCEQYSHNETFLLEWLRREMFSIAGLSYIMGEKQCRHLVMTIEEEGFGKLSLNGKIALNMERIRQEIAKLKMIVEKRMAHSAGHIMTWAELRNKIGKIKGGKAYGTKNIR